MGLPGISALWMLGLILEPIGVPPEVGIVALLAIAPILDPLFTMVNVFRQLHGDDHPRPLRGLAHCDRRSRPPSSPRGDEVGTNAGTRAAPKSQAVGLYSPSARAGYMPWLSWRRGG